MVIAFVSAFILLVAVVTGAMRWRMRGQSSRLDNPQDQYKRSVKKLQGAVSTPEARTSTRTTSIAYTAPTAAWAVAGGPADEWAGAQPISVSPRFGPPFRLSRGAGRRLSFHNSALTEC